MYIYDRPLSVLQSSQRYQCHHRLPGLGQLPCPDEKKPDPVAGLRESPRMQGRLTEALDQMRQSSDPNEQMAAAPILNGSHVVAFPPLLIDRAQKNEPVSLAIAITRMQNRAVPGQPRADIYIFPHSQLDAKGRPLPGQVGVQLPGLNANAVTFATAGDRHIYLLRSDLGFTTKKLKTTLLHESFHLRYPLPRGHSSRDKFIAELRAYYYAEHRDVNDLRRRFELAARSAAKDSGDVAIDGPDFAARVVNRALWLQQIAL